MSRALGCEIKSIADYRTGFLVKPFTASDTESHLAVTNRKVSDFHGRKKSFGLKDMSRGGYRGKIRVSRKTLWGYAYNLVSLYKKKGMSTTPLSCALNCLILALNDSAAAFDALLT